jgi:hypothetical protein
MFCERLRYDLLFRWFLDMGLDDEPFDPTSFGKNRERLIEHDVAKEFFAAVVERARAEGLVSSEHFSVDGTLIEAWASLKSFRPKDEPAAKDNNGWADFRGRKRSNDTHASTTDSDARLWRKGKGREAKLCFMGHSLMENRERLARRHARHAGDRSRRARRGARDGRRARSSRCDARGRPRLRHRRLHRGVPLSWHDAARRTEHQQAALGHRRSDNSLGRLRKSASSSAGSSSKASAGPSRWAASDAVDCAAS